MPNRKLTPPKLDESLVNRLAAIAAQLDGADKASSERLVREFNRLAGTQQVFADFQGICGTMEYDTHVRGLLTAQLTSPAPNLSRDEMVEIFRKVLADPTDERYLEFAFATIEKTFGDRHVSDLVFWPGEYFGDGDHSRNLSPEEMADAVLDRYRKDNAR